MGVSTLPTKSRSRVATIQDTEGFCHGTNRSRSLILPSVFHGEGPPTTEPRWSMGLRRELARATVPPSSEAPRRGVKCPGRCRRSCSLSMQTGRWCESLTPMSLFSGTKAEMVQGGESMRHAHVTVFRNKNGHRDVGRRYEVRSLSPGCTGGGARGSARSAAPAHHHNARHARVFSQPRHQAHVGTWWSDATPIPISFVELPDTLDVYSPCVASGCVCGNRPSLHHRLTLVRQRKGSDRG